MADGISIDGWREDGKRLWQHIQERGELAFAWCNPWFRVSVVGLGILGVAIACQFIFHNVYLALAIAFLSLLFLYNGARFLLLDLRVGGLYFFYSAEAFGVGGAAKRIVIPYSAVALPEFVTPSTVNSNYIDLPVPPDRFEAISIEHADGKKEVWNRQPFKQAIAQVRVQNGRLIAKAYPNEFICQMFSTLYPLVAYLAAEDRADPDPSRD